ncbi:MAG: AAA family ATPase, partial [Conexivisphaera sp.]
RVEITTGEGELLALALRRPTDEEILSALLELLADLLGYRGESATARAWAKAEESLTLNRFAEVVRTRFDEAKLAGLLAQALTAGDLSRTTLPGVALECDGKRAVLVNPSLVWRAVSELIHAVERDHNVERDHELTQYYTKRWKMISLIDIVTSGAIGEVLRSMCARGRSEHSSFYYDSAYYRFYDISEIPGRARTQLVALEIERELKEMMVEEDLVRFNFDSVVLRGPRGEYEVPMGEMGSGFSALAKLMAILTGLATTREKPGAGMPDVLLLEEPELHMHPGYISKLVAFLTRLSMRSGIQLFISTHSPDLLQELLGDQEHGGVLGEDERRYLREQLRVVQLARNFKGESIARVFGSEEARVSMQGLLLDLRGP